MNSPPLICLHILVFNSQLRTLFKSLKSGNTWRYYFICCQAADRDSQIDLHKEKIKFNVKTDTLEFWRLKDTWEVKNNLFSFPTNQCLEEAYCVLIYLNGHSAPESAGGQLFDINSMSIIERLKNLRFN